MKLKKRHGERNGTKNASGAGSELECAIRAIRAIPAIRARAAIATSAVLVRL
jgi:hypothetical protein